MLFSTSTFNCAAADPSSDTTTHFILPTCQAEDVQLNEADKNNIDLVDDYSYFKCDSEKSG